MNGTLKLLPQRGWGVVQLALGSSERRGDPLFDLRLYIYFLCSLLWVSGLSATLLIQTVITNYLE